MAYYSMRVLWTLSAWRNMRIARAAEENRAGYRKASSSRSEAGGGIRKKGFETGDCRTRAADFLD